MSQASPSSASSRPGPPLKTHSFPRFEPTDDPLTRRSRTNTLSNEATGPMLAAGEDYGDSKTPTAEVASLKRQDSVADSLASEMSVNNSPNIEDFPENFDELPIELASLTDRFIISLTTARLYPTPPSVEKLSDLFQDFYLQAESHISTHVQELRSRQYRDASPAPSISSRSSGRKVARDTLERRATGQAMLTSTELHERKRARKLLEYKRGALEEAIEKKVCEEIYDRIWRHRSTLDEERDEKLRSRTAGLAVMGVGLKELGVELTLNDDSDAWVEKARKSLCEMDAAHYPLGKLKCLASAHHSVVELLASCHQTSSSADEILPTLIYVLIGSPVDQMNLISNLHFVQRFRTASKMSGEAAYCLTNLEAAITFLETVDITTLGGVEETDAQTKQRSRSHTSPPVPSDATVSATIEEEGGDGVDSASMSSATSTSARKPKAPPPSALKLADIRSTSPPISPAPTTAKRPLSALFTPQAAFGAAGDAMRSTADEGLRNIGSALDKSFNFMFGRLREHSVAAAAAADPLSPAGHTVVVAPKTLDEARRLVSPKAMLVEEDGLVLSENSSIMEADEAAAANPPALREDRFLDMITGARSGRRDRSADSAGSGASGSAASGANITSAAAAASNGPASKRPGSLHPDSRASSSSTIGAGVASLGVSPPFSTSAAAVSESMKNFGTSLNPLNRLSGMRFGRSSPVQQQQTLTTLGPASPDPLAASNNFGVFGGGAAGGSQTPDPAAKIDPPLKQFLETSDASQLRLVDVAVLLKDYQRLAEAVRTRGLL